MKNIAFDWLVPRPAGLYCVPGDFYIDPLRKVDRAVITHGHADHARPGHTHVLATAETHAVNRIRLKGRAGQSQQALGRGEHVTLNGVRVSLAPAGHIFGSAQVVVEYGGQRIIVTGDFKRGFDPTCPAFEPVDCDVFVSEATFARPIYRHPDPVQEMSRLMKSLTVFPDRCHLINTYGLGKSQRLMALLRHAGWDQPIYAHDGLIEICEVYGRFGVSLGDVRPLSQAAERHLKGQVVFAPVNAVRGMDAPALKTARRIYASGWMRLRKRAEASGADLPLIISDHADWPELTRTISDVGAPEIWVTHGYEDDLVAHCHAQGRRAMALSARAEVVAGG